MAYEKTSSGLLFDESFVGPGIPVGWSEVKTGGASITYSNSMVWVSGIATLAYVVQQVPLPVDKIFVLRCYVHSNAAENQRLFGVADKVAEPNADLPRANMVAHFLRYGGAPENINFWTDGVEGTCRQNVGNGTNKIYEIASDATDVVCRQRHAATLAIEDSDTRAWGHADLPNPTNDMWAVCGDTSTAWSNGNTDATYIQAYLSNDVVITDLVNGYTVKLYDAGDVLLTTSAPAAGGEAVMDCSLLDFDEGIVGYFKVFNGAVEIRRLPAAGNFTGEPLYGGDEWSGGDALPPVPTPPGGPWIVSGWDSTDGAGTPGSGRIVGEDGQVYNYNESGVLVPIVGMIVPVPVHATGRFKREDSTDINIADNLERRT